MNARILSLVSHYTTAFGAVFMLGTGTSLALNLLTDPGFESGTPTTGNTFLGWTVGESQNVAFSQDYAHSGVWSMKVSVPGNFYFAGAWEFVSNAVPGTAYTLNGWGLTPTQISSFGIAALQIQFMDGNFQPLGTVETGPGDLAQSASIDSSSAPGTWIPLSVTATAPDNSTYMFVQLGVDYYSAATVYFDDLSLSPVPEPAAFMIFGLGAAALLWMRYR